VPLRSAGAARFRCYSPQHGWLCFAERCWPRTDQILRGWPRPCELSTALGAMLPGLCWRWRPAGDYDHHPVLGETHDYRNYNLCVRGTISIKKKEKKMTAFTQGTTFRLRSGLRLGLTGRVLSTLHRSQAVVLCLIPAAKHR